MTIDQFYKKITELPTKHKNRDLEEYLLALYALVLENTEKEMNMDLFFNLLESAFTASPIPFDESWLAIEAAPDGNRINRKFTNPAFADSVDKNNASEMQPLEFTLEVIRFQIADLHKMRGKQLDDKYRFFGIDSDTGNRWYNFDPFGNLECGARCMEDNNDVIDNADWSLLGELLEDGRIYE